MRVGVDQACELVSEPMRILTMDTSIGWDRMELIQSAGAELCAAAQAAVMELCRLAEDQVWPLPALAEKSAQAWRAAVIL